MPKQVKVKSDGKNLTFTPGQNGSLISDDSGYEQKDLDVEPKQASKTVPSPLTDDQKKNRKALLQVFVGSTRG